MDRKCDGMFFRIRRYLNVTLLVISRLRFPTERSAFLWFLRDVLLLFFLLDFKPQIFHILAEKQESKQVFHFVSLFEVKSYCQFLDHKAVMYYKLTFCVKNNFTYSYSQDSTSKMYFPLPSPHCAHLMSSTLMKADTKMLASSSSVNQPNEYRFFTLIYCKLCLLCARSAAVRVTSA